MAELDTIVGLIKSLGGQPDPEDVAAAVAAYLEAHPEAACPIDDTAGEGDTDKVWSADKSAEEIETLSSAIVPLQDGQYEKIEKSGIPDEKMTEKVLKYLADIKVALGKLYKSLFDDDKLDLHVEMEAMKMANALQAEKAGKVTAICVKVGESVMEDDALVVKWEKNHYH